MQTFLPSQLGLRRTAVAMKAIEPTATPVTTFLFLVQIP